jgi:hypothetical protein
VLFSHFYTLLKPGLVISVQKNYNINKSLSYKGVSKMTDDEFLALSRYLNSFNFDNKMSYHIIRYKFFFDSSSKGHLCHYCKLTKSLSYRENELEKLKLMAIFDNERLNNAKD